MKSNLRESLNYFLVHVFNDILKTEELCISDKTFHNLSLREIHVIESVCEAETAAVSTGNKLCNSATSIAHALRITPGTLTTAVTSLVKKGFIYREKDEKDKRIVRIFTTELGKEAQQKHMDFHNEMVDEILSQLTDEEVSIFCRSLEKLKDFFFQKYFK